MAKLIWTIASIDDMNEIGDFVGLSSIDYAAFLIKEFLHCEKLLLRFPRLGRVFPEADIPAIRELLIHGYRVIYFLDENDDIRVLRVQHSAKPIGKINLN